MLWLDSRASQSVGRARERTIGNGMWYAALVLRDKAKTWLVPIRPKWELEEFEFKFKLDSRLSVAVHLTVDSSSRPFVYLNRLWAFWDSRLSF